MANQLDAVATVKAINTLNKRLRQTESKLKQLEAKVWNCFAAADSASANARKTRALFNRAEEAVQDECVFEAQKAGSRQRFRAMEAGLRVSVEGESFIVPWPAVCMAIDHLSPGRVAGTYNALVFETPKVRGTILHLDHDFVMEFKDRVRVSADYKVLYEARMSTQSRNWKGDCKYLGGDQKRPKNCSLAIWHGTFGQE